MNDVSSLQRTVVDIEAAAVAIVLFQIGILYMYSDM